MSKKKTSKDAQAISAKPLLSSRSVLRGKYVSRATFQKIAEENKRLKNDLRILTAPEFDKKDERWDTIQKWRKKFIEDRQFSEMLRDFAKEYTKEHPEYDITKRAKQNGR